jgi:hypothetical protein
MRVVGVSLPVLFSSFIMLRVLCVSLDFLTQYHLISTCCYCVPRSKVAILALYKGPRYNLNREPRTFPGCLSHDENEDDIRFASAKYMYRLLIHYSKS